MLPITRHKSFQIPHSLATCAAIIALIAAMSWETSADDISTVRASSADESRIEAAQAQEQQSTDKPERSVRASAAECDQTCNGNSLSKLLPLVLPSLSRH